MPSRHSWMVGETAPFQGSPHPQDTQCRGRGRRLGLENRAGSRGRSLSSGKDGHRLLGPLQLVLAQTRRTARMGRQDPFILGQTIGVYTIFLPQKEHRVFSALSVPSGALS